MNLKELRDEVSDQGFLEVNWREFFPFHDIHDECILAEREGLFRNYTGDHRQVCAPYDYTSHFTELTRFLNKLPYKRFTQCDLFRLTPKGEIPWHNHKIKDREGFEPHERAKKRASFGKKGNIVPSQGGGMSIMNMSINYPKGVKFEMKFGDEIREIPYGSTKCFWLNTYFDHRVINNSAIDRYHLVFNGVIDEPLFVNRIMDSYNGTANTRRLLS
tara:strand:+ start:501 stop:1148 length:648 start_codon:yes stop_codon:yes gene_type:complete